MIVRCMTCKAVVVGKPGAIVGCLCDPDAPTWLAIENENQLLGGTYRYFIPLTEVPDDADEV
jgi:hypothetical protein